MNILHKLLKHKRTVVLLPLIVLGLLLSCNFRKGIAHWWSTNNSAESREKGVFVAYYDALPFEYEDSICHIKLVFDEVYVEWMHWYENSDKAMKHCLYYENSDTRKDQQQI